MAVVIKKFVIVNNYGTVRITDHVNDTSTETTNSNNGATGPVITDYVNGKKQIKKKSGEGTTTTTNLPSTR